jgi:hypothetical protein
MEGVLVNLARTYIRNSGTRQAQLRVGEEEAEKKQAVGGKVALTALIK